MRILLILIIAGFGLITLGSPGIIKQAGNDITRAIQHLPERASTAIQEKDTAYVNQPSTTASPDFTNIDPQDDIPAGEVLDQPFTPETKMVSLPPVDHQTTHRAVGYQNQHSIDEIHAVNVSALEVLDRISANYQ